MRSLKMKLLAFCLLVGILPFLIIGAVGLVTGSDALRTQTDDSVTSIRDIKAYEVQSLSERWSSDLEMLQSDMTCLRALGDLGSYAVTSGAAPGKRMDVTDEWFKDLQQEYDADLGRYVRALGYYDVFLIDRTGRVLFTSALESDVGEDLAKGRLKDSGLAMAWAEAVQGGQAFIDFAPYAPSAGEPAAFVAAPVMDGESIAGVAALQISMENINALMTLRTGMGETGETYLVGPDHLMRSDSHLDPDGRTVVASFADPADGSVETRQVDLALDGKTGSGLFVNYLGHSVFAAYAPVRVGDTTWALVAEKDEAEAFAAISTLRNTMIGAGAVILVLVVVSTLFVLRRELLKPFDQLRTYSDAVASGSLDAACTGSFSTELADVRGSIESMVCNLKEKMDEAEHKGEEAARKAREAEEALTDSRRKEERVRALLDKMHQISEQADAIAERVATAAEQLSAQSEQLSSGAATQRDRIGETVTAMGEMNATVLEVARNAGESSSSAESAREHAQQGARIVTDSVQAIDGVREATEELSANMQTLGERADAIGQVMNVITDIADQTNLLALNAAIEAARAGDAGRGFAVVADEVRKLAEKTMTATQEVGQSIQAIQDATRRNIQDMEKAAELVGRATGLAEQSGGMLADILSLAEESSGKAASIAAASEEQSAASEQIGRAIDEVHRIVEETSEGVVQSGEAVRALAAMSAELRQLIQELRDA